MKISKRNAWGVGVFLVAAAVWLFDGETSREPSAVPTPGYFSGDERASYGGPAMTLEQHMARTVAEVQRGLSNYIELDRARLEQELEQYVQATGQRVTLEEYARQKVYTEAARRQAAIAPASNPMFEQQKRMFEAGQKAHADRQVQYGAQNDAWAAQQRSIESNNNRFIQQGIQGNQYYKNTETGQVAELPFAGNTGVYGNQNGDTYVSGGMGEFGQVGPNGSVQEMEGYDPGYYE